MHNLTHKQFLWTWNNFRLVNNVSLDIHVVCSWYIDHVLDISCKHKVLKIFLNGTQQVATVNNFRHWILKKKIIILKLKTILCWHYHILAALFIFHIEFGHISAVVLLQNSLMSPSIIQYNHNYSSQSYHTTWNYRMQWRDTYETQTKKKNTLELLCLNSLCRYF